MVGQCLEVEIGWLHEAGASGQLVGGLVPIVELIRRASGGVEREILDGAAKQSLRCRDEIPVSGLRFFECLRRAADDAGDLHHVRLVTHEAAEGQQGVGFDHSDHFRELLNPAQAAPVQADVDLQVDSHGHVQLPRELLVLR
jgi:hypothetical protein